MFREAYYANAPKLLHGFVSYCSVSLAPSLEAVSWSLLPRASNSVKISSEFISKLPMCPFIHVTSEVKMMFF